MKVRFIVFTCALLMLPILTSAKGKISSDTLSDADKIQILLTLIKNQDIIFSPSKDQQLGCAPGETLGNYLSRLIVFGSQGDKHSLTISCERYNKSISPLAPPTQNAKGKDCKLSAFTSDQAGESPWHYEIIFRVGPDFKSLERANLACPGTP